MNRLSISLNKIVRILFLAGGVFCSLQSSWAESIEHCADKREVLSKHHINAVGLAVIRLDAEYVDRGTATLIEPDIAVSAAHVFKSLFPQESLGQTEGVIHIDLRTRGVYIYFRPEDGAGPVRKVRVLSLVVDARFLHLSASSKSGRLSQQAQAYDVVFLELERPVPDIRPVPIYRREGKISNMCASYGFGVSSMQEVPQRQGIVYALDLPDVSQGFKVIRLNNRNNTPRCDYNQAIREVSVLTGEPGFAPHEAYVGQARPGDSGGPLFALTPKGIRIIGVMSIFGKQKFDTHVEHYNGFCSLIALNSKGGYSARLYTQELLEYLKRHRLKKR